MWTIMNLASLFRLLGNSRRVTRFLFHYLLFLCLLKETFLSSRVGYKIAFYSDVLWVICLLFSSPCIILQLHYLFIQLYLINESKYSQLCTSYNRHQNQSGTAHPLNNLFRAAQEAWATCAQRDHPEGSRRSWGEGETKRYKETGLKIKWSERSSGNQYLS